jgi:hypothetical protein
MFAFGDAIFAGALAAITINIAGPFITVAGVAACGCADAFGVAFGSLTFLAFAGECVPG